MKPLTIGEIVFWTLVRAAVIIPVVWFSQPYFDYSLWWMGSAVFIYAGIIHPAIIHFNLYREDNKPIFEGTLCSSCKHFDKSAILCVKHDEHPSTEFLPCEGLDWEPKSVDDAGDYDDM